MKPILRVMTDTCCEVNALLIQPTQWCANNCKGCYVKNYQMKGPHLRPKVIVDLFHKFFTEQDYSANQITFSMDKLQYNTKGFDVMRFRHLLAVYNGIFDVLASVGVNADSREVHMTFNSIEDLRAYDSHGRYSTTFMSLLKMVSFSNISPLEAQSNIRNIVGNTVRINYNHIIPANITSKNVDAYIERMTKIGEGVDSIYLIIFKESMGKEPQIDKKILQSRLSHDLAVINTLRSRLPKHVWGKTRIDGCLQDAANYLRTGESCSSNVSKFQVWPDGSVTGCPYAINSVGKSGRTVNNIVANIRWARRQNEFRQRCYIPEILNSISKRPKSNRTEV